jgi:hypothetical protein
VSRKGVAALTGGLDRVVTWLTRSAERLWFAWLVVVRVRSQPLGLFWVNRRLPDSKRLGNRESGGKEKHGQQHHNSDIDAF